ncbi:MAG: RNA-binding S4 domain-containing protein [Peptostreptococcales bacterium]
MRIDKFLKISRLIKRRTIAKEACDNGRVLINDKPCKAGSELKIGDVITILYNEYQMKFKVKNLLEHVTKETAQTLYESIED